MTSPSSFPIVAPSGTWVFSGENTLCMPPFFFFFFPNRPQTPNPILFTNPRRRRSTSLLPCQTITAHIAEDAPPASTSASPPTLRHVCKGRVPDHILQKAEEAGFTIPTDVQTKSLPILLSQKDCILHAQTGSGKTLAYLLSIFSAISYQRSAVQALIVVPTRELGIQVTKVARKLGAKSAGLDTVQKTCTVMALLDGGMLKRHKSWLKAEPPEIVVATIGSLCQMLEKRIFKLEALKVLVIDEVDFMFYSSKQVHSLRKLLTSYSTIKTRQTIFASASIPQHNHFLSECIQQKWTKICKKRQRLHTLLSILQNDKPKSAIVFVGDQSERSKRVGETPSSTLVIEFLKSNYKQGLEILLLEEDMNFNARVTSLLDVRQGCCILVATDIAGRGVDLPETTHIYNFDLPKTATDYLHRAGRTGRKPFSDEIYTVTSLITQEERFVLQKFENELMFHCSQRDGRLMWQWNLGVQQSCLLVFFH